MFGDNNEYNIMPDKYLKSIKMFRYLGLYKY